MKLYLTPGTCSLASNIALHEAGIPFELVKVDKRTKRANGIDFLTINPKGYVPALQLDDGQVLTENVVARGPESRRKTRSGRGNDAALAVAGMAEFHQLRGA